MYSCFVYQLYLNKSVKIFLMDPHVKFSSILLAFPSSFLNVTDLSEIKEVGKPWHAKHDQCSMVYFKFLDTFHKAQKHLYFLIYFIRRALIQVSSVQSNTPSINHQVGSGKDHKDWKFPVLRKLKVQKNVIFLKKTYISYLIP